MLLLFAQKELVTIRLSLRSYNRPILLKYQCQVSQTDPLPACPPSVETNVC